MQWAIGSQVPEVIALPTSEQRRSHWVRAAALPLWGNAGMHVCTAALALHTQASVRMHAHMYV